MFKPYFQFFSPNSPNKKHYKSLILSNFPFFPVFPLPLSPFLYPNSDTITTVRFPSSPSFIFSSSLSPLLSYLPFLFSPLPPPILSSPSLLFSFSFLLPSLFYSYLPLNHIPTLFSVFLNSQVNHGILIDIAAARNCSGKNFSYKPHGNKHGWSSTAAGQQSKSGTLTVMVHFNINQDKFSINPHHLNFL